MKRDSFKDSYSPSVKGFQFTDADDIFDAFQYRAEHGETPTPKELELWRKDKCKK